MSYFKSVFASLLLLLLMTACNAESTLEPPVPTAIMTVETVSTPLPIETEPVSESVGGDPDLIAVKFIDAARVIPAGLDPSSQSQEVVSQYLQTTGDGSNLWAGGLIGDSNIFFLEIVGVNQDLPNIISVTFPLRLKIVEKIESIEDVSMLSPMGGGGGGGELKIFPSLSLQAGEFEMMPDDPSPVNLMKDVQQLTYFFDMSCAHSGVFDLQFTIPYSVTGNMVTQERTLDYTIQLVCPESATLWHLSDPNTGQIENGGTWIFQDGRYVPQQ
jgi:hypothetical protein